ncbi:uncharacterized protein LOC109816185 [Cajanus cajan]|uniref:uncharacterized protein LOC109816185 n=1 Tax=Cajanus cajan TaxID=3821 RepID=UPI00098DA418|nr:uncharacterized protein LOC109816185 [Cajanus cajan]
MKFHGNDGKIISVKANQKTARQCYTKSLKIASPGEQCKSGPPTAAHINHEEITDLDPRSDSHDERASPVDELDDLQIGKFPRQCTKISRQLSPKLRQQLKAEILKNADLFAWSSADMQGIDADFICQRLAIHKEAKPVAQRKRKVGGERREAIITESQKLLSAGFIREVRGMEANPEKCKAIIQMQSPQTMKEVQRLAGRLVSLSRFIPKLAEKAGPIFTLLKKPKDFQWTSQCEEAFQSFKTFLSTPPILQRSNHNTDLLLYLAIAKNAISAVIVQENQKTQTLIYFISRVLQDAEKRYQTVEKLALALVTAARRLRPYFQSHQVVVKTDYPIKQILSKSELAGRMIAWLVVFSEFSIRYKSRGALKAQCLADFVAELTPVTAEEPQAEYEALLVGLRLARRVSCNSDSKLMVEQLNGTYQAKDTFLQRYFHIASQQISSFDEFAIQHVPREQNAQVDLLSKLASTKKLGQHRTIIQETLHSPSFDDKVVNVSDSGDLGWMTGIWNYLKEGTLPKDKDEARKMRMRSAKFVVVGDELFKRGISTPLLKCLTAPQAANVIDEIHRGICGLHSGACSMATRVLRAGYYWPTLKGIVTGVFLDVILLY